MTEKLKYLHRYIDRHGRQRCYFRRYDQRIAIVAPEGTPEFFAEYEAAKAAKPKARDGSDLTGPVVYFVRGGDRVKIGTTKQRVNTRVRAMQVGSPLK